MLTQEDNEMLCRVGPGTPMGHVLRRYWHPFLLSEELPESDGPPIRIRLLGEDLVAFRDTKGQVGLLSERCPHRGASLFFGINQDRGLMCIYHGWKFDVNGQCVDIPSDLPGSTFKAKVRAASYPCIESAGAVWAYMGPAEHQPPPPDFMFNRVEPDCVMATRTPIYCNWVQSLEGNIDSSHLGTLHRYLDDFQIELTEPDQPGYPNLTQSIYQRAHYRYANVEVQDTSYGFRLIAIRPTEAGNQHLRINCQVLPYTTFIAAPRGSAGPLMHVPVDDENCFRMSFSARPGRPFTTAEREQRKRQAMVMDPNYPTMRLLRRDNDYMIDREAQKTKLISGIWSGGEQDYCVTESMGPIYDRTNEHLYAADAAIIRLRQMLLSAARGINEGEQPPALDPDIPFHKIRSEEIIIGPDDDAWQVAAEAGEMVKRGERLR